MHEVTDRFDRPEGTMRTDVLTIDGDRSSIVREVDEHMSNTSDIDTSSIDKRLTRIDLLLFRSPVSDFLKIHGAGAHYSETQRPVWAACASRSSIVCATHHPHAACCKNI